MGSEYPIIDVQHSRKGERGALASNSEGVKDVRLNWVHVSCKVMSAALEFMSRTEAILPLLQQGGRGPCIF